MVLTTIVGSRKDTHSQWITLIKSCLTFTKTLSRILILSGFCNYKLIGSEYINSSRARSRPGSKITNKTISNFIIDSPNTIGNSIHPINLTQTKLWAIIIITINSRDNKGKRDSAKTTRLCKECDQKHSENNKIGCKI